jgi:hypothetical protein
MSASIDSLLPDPSLAVTVIEETPPKPWSGADFGITTLELEQAYQRALALVAPAPTAIGPLVPDEFVDEPLPADRELIDDAVGAHRRHVLLIGFAILGLTLGMAGALLL